jgi:anti-anti-sigma factor
VAALTGRRLQVEVDNTSGYTVLRLKGRLDHQSAPALKDRFRDVVARASHRIDLDLAAVDRVDGLGLAALVWARGLARDCGVELRLTRMGPHVRDMVAKMNLHHLLEIAHEPLIIPAARRREAATQRSVG